VLPNGEDKIEIGKIRDRIGRNRYSNFYQPARQSKDLTTLNSVLI